MEFSGKELIKGESGCVQSFPSGGLRATFEARGYTAWDPTSYAFIKDRTLCIPTAFCSYTGQVLDKKTPLLRSMEAINQSGDAHSEAVRRRQVTARHSRPSGPEQEYFLIDQEMFLKRKDLRSTPAARCLARSPPKGQELEDHYFGAMKARVSDFMQRSGRRAVEAGRVRASTEHNEVAPAQHELAPVFTDRKRRRRSQPADHGADAEGCAASTVWPAFCTKSRSHGVNGSGKHNNWSLSHRHGREPSESRQEPGEQRVVLCLFLCGGHSAR